MRGKAFARQVASYTSENGIRACRMAGAFHLKSEPFIFGQTMKANQTTGGMHTVAAALPVDMQNKPRQQTRPASLLATSSLQKPLSSTPRATLR